MTEPRAPREGGRKARLLLVDDHPLMRAGVRSLVNQQPDLEVCGEAEDAEQALEMVSELAPDLAVIDISLGKTNGISLIKHIRARRADLPLLVLSMHDEPLFVEHSLKAGAAGYVTKHEDPSVLVTAIRRLLDGKVYISERLGSAMLHELVTAGRDRPASTVEVLSDREFEVFGMIGQGLDVREMAAQLRRSRRTIETHRENIKKKLGLKSAAELVRYAYRWRQAENGV
jgi:DNA-binding NarL/FixJ family response regulator